MRNLVFGAILALAACMPNAPQGAPSAQGNKEIGAAAQSAQQADAPAPTGDDNVQVAQQSGPVIDRGFMIGRWGDNGDCSKDIVLDSDGSFTSYTGGGGQWTLFGDTLRLQGAGGTFDMRLELINENALRITNQDGSVGTSQRC